MGLTDFLMILSVLVAPLVAIQVQRWIEDYKRIRERKEWIFKTLMATRGETLSRDHVGALNMIDIEYHGDKKGVKIVQKWKEYLDHLGSYPHDGTDAQKERWDEIKREALTDILFEMAKYLGYNFDRLSIKKSIYVPQFYSEMELEQQAIRKGVLSMIYGGRSMPINIVMGDEEAKDNMVLRDLLIRYHKGEIPIKVKIDD